MSLSDIEIRNLTRAIQEMSRNVQQAAAELKKFNENWERSRLAESINKTTNVAVVNGVAFSCEHSDDVIKHNSRIAESHEYDPGDVENGPCVGRIFIPALGRESGIICGHPREAH